MKNTGILRIQAFGARQSSPIEGVLVTVSGNGFTAQRITDETGTAADLSIEAPSCALSLQEDNTIRPYAVVDLTAAKAGFRTVRIILIRINLVNIKTFLNGVLDQHRFLVLNTFRFANFIFIFFTQAAINCRFHDLHLSFFAQSSMRNIPHSPLKFKDAKSGAGF
mgnify:CR=1 FL=1